MNDAEALGRVFWELRGKMRQELVGYELGFTQRKVSDLERKGIYLALRLFIMKLSFCNGNRKKVNQMSRPPKHPEHKEQAEKLMNNLLDSLVSLWTSEKEPQLQSIAEELEMSPAKVRKLLITAGVRDGKKYYENPVADQVLKLWKEKKAVAEIAAATGLSRSSVTGYTPHSKIIYSLDTMSTEAERIKLYRTRCAAVEELQKHLNRPDVSDTCGNAFACSRNILFKHPAVATITQERRSSDIW